MPISRPRRKAAISEFRCARFSARCQVPWPTTGIRSPDGNLTVFMAMGMKTVSIVADRIRAHRQAA
jgi:hypothetical protein